MTDTATLTPEIVEFLNHGTRTGMLGWLASDGRPLVAPVWFLAENGELVFNTGGAVAKARAISRDPRVTLTADLDQPPYAFVQVQGIARIVTDLDDVRRVATAVGGRYMGAARAEEFGARNGVPGEIAVYIRPTKVNSSLDMTS